MSIFARHVQKESKRYVVIHKGEINISFLYFLQGEQRYSLSPTSERIILIR